VNTVDRATSLIHPAEHGAPARTATAGRARLYERLRSYESVCIGYSGGVDSAFLVVTAVEALGAGRVLAVTGVSPSVSQAQLDAARRIARAHGVPHFEVGTEELEDPSYAANPTDRCYFCKSELWSRLSVVAAERGFAVLADGTNADDTGDHRPGTRAGREHDVRSPLLEAGLTKPEIRALSLELGLETWDAPAAPCLASRVQHGLGVTRERLRQVEEAEAGIARLGFREFRVRHHGDIARLEFASGERERAFERSADVVAAARAAGFARAGIDALGYRRGALHEGALVQISAALPASRIEGARGVLREHGVSFDDVCAAGFEGDVLWVRAPVAAAAAVERLEPRLCAAGFRWIAFEAQSDPLRRTA